MEDELVKRIPDNMLVPDAQAGEVWSHLDVNDVYIVTKEAINANYDDIQKLQNGTTQIGSAEKIDGASLSRSTTEGIQSDDNKISSSKQVKDYIDNHTSNIEVHTNQFERLSYNSHIENDEIHVTTNDKSVWGAKANTSDIPTKISDITNDLNLIDINALVPGVNVTLDKDALNNKVTINATGGVDSVNGQAGVVVLDTSDIQDTVDKRYSTDSEKAKLASIASGAEVNVNADWNADSGDAQILNKPTIPTALSQLAEDNTHRVTTDAEKEAWNSKQNILVADTDYLTPNTASTTYEPKKGVNDNYVTDTQMASWDAKQNALIADTDYLKPSTASSTYQPKMGSDDNYVTDAEKVIIANTSGVNTGDQDLSGKQNVLVSGTNIKTINGNSLLGSGDITISGGSGTGVVESIVAGDNISVDNTDPANPIVSSPSKTASDISYDPIYSMATYTHDATNTQQAIDMLDDALSNNLGSKQDNLVSGTNIKTVNGTSLLGSGDITVSGGGSGDMTKSVYDPNNKNDDAFDMDNMVEGITNKILTVDERTKLSNTSNTNTGDETQATIKTKLGVASAGVDGYLSGASFTTFNNKQNAVSGVSQAEAEAGTSTLLRLYTPQRVAQAIAALSPIKTVYGRTGTIVAQSGDYSADKITFDGSSCNAASVIAATNVQSAIVALDDELLLTNGGLDSLMANNTGVNTGDQDLSSYALKSYVDGKGIFYVTSYNEFVAALQNTTYYQKVIYAYYNSDGWNNAITSTITVHGANYVHGNVQINDEIMTMPTLTFSGSMGIENYIYFYDNFGVVGSLTLDGFCTLCVNTFWTPGITINASGHYFSYMRTTSGLASSPRAYQDNWLTDSLSFVHNTGAETIDGIKTFGSIPILPSTTPTADNQAVTKGYVDTHSGGITSSDSSVTDIQTVTLAEYNALTTEQRANKMFNITDELSAETTIVDGFTSTSTTNASSANNAKVLNDKILGFTPVSLLATPLQASATLSSDVIATLSDNYTNYDLILFYISNGSNGAEGRWDYIMPVLPTSYWEVYVLGGYNAHGRIQFSASNKVSFMVREITGWSSTSMYLSKVMGVKLTH